MLSTIIKVIEKLQSVLTVKVVQTPKNDEEVIEILDYLSDLIIERLKQLQSAIRQKGSEYDQLEFMVQKNETRNKEQAKSEQALQLQISYLRSQLVEQDKIIIESFKRNQNLQNQLSRVSNQNSGQSSGRGSTKHQKLRKIVTQSLEHKLPSPSVKQNQNTLPIVKAGRDFTSASAERKPKHVRVNTDANQNGMSNNSLNDSQFIKGEIDKINYTIKMRKQSKLVGILKLNQYS